MVVHFLSLYLATHLIFIGMRMMWIICALMILAATSTAYTFMIAPGEIITEGNCSGHLDYFLCNCLTSNITVDIHLLSGNHNFTKQSGCLLKNKTNISITGGTAGDTTIECIEPFNIVFMSVQNVTISNIKMIGCGAVMNDVINKSISETLTIGYLSEGFRFVLCFTMSKM